MSPLLFSPVQPARRQQAAMAYDAATGTVVLFGGVFTNVNHAEHILGDTWTWG